MLTKWEGRTAGHKDHYIPPKLCLQEVSLRYTYVYGNMDELKPFLRE